MKSTEVLKWAAGAEVELPESAVNESELLYLLSHHRLAGRFTDRVQRERPVWCSRRLKIRAWQMHTQAKAHLHSQLRALREIAAAVSSQPEPLLTVKGFSAYALTGDERTIHWSGDLDLFSDDLDGTWQAMQRLGYSGEKGDQWNHEFVTAWRGDVMIELHSYFPVASYATGVLGIDLSPKANPGCWLQRFTTDETQEAVEKRICYRDLIETATGGATAETRDLLVVDPGMAVLILCAHQMRDYHLSPPWVRPLGVNLGELADIRELMRHPHFEERRFAELVEAFDGHDSIRFVATLLQSYFGADPLTPLVPPPVAADLPASSSFSSSSCAPVPASQSAPAQASPAQPGFFLPRRLSWLGGWVAPDGAEDLLLPLDMAALFDQLEANTIVADAEGRTRLCAYPARPGAEPIERLIIQLQRGEPFAFGFCVSCDQRALRFEVSLRQPRVNLYTFDFETAHRDLHHHAGVTWDEVPRELEQDGQGEATLSRDENGFTLRVEFAWESLPQRFRGNDANPILLSIIRWDQGPAVVTLVPLNILRK